MILFVEITTVAMELRVRGTLTARGKVWPGTFDVYVGGEVFQGLSVAEPHVNSSSRLRMLSIRLGPESFHLADRLTTLPCRLSFVAPEATAGGSALGTEPFELAATILHSYLTLAGTVLEQPERATQERIVLARGNGATGRDLPPDVGRRVLQDGRWPEGVLPPARVLAPADGVGRQLEMSEGGGDPTPIQFAGGEFGQLRLADRRVEITLAGNSTFAASCQPLLRSGRAFLLPIGSGLHPASANGVEADAALPELVAVAV